MAAERLRELITAGDWEAPGLTKLIMRYERSYRNARTMEIPVEQNTLPWLFTRQGATGTMTRARAAPPSPGVVADPPEAPAVIDTLPDWSGWPAGGMVGGSTASSCTTLGAYALLQDYVEQSSADAERFALQKRLQELLLPLGVAEGSALYTALRALSLPPPTRDEQRERALHCALLADVYEALLRAPPTLPLAAALETVDALLDHYTRAGAAGGAAGPGAARRVQNLLEKLHAAGVAGDSDLWKRAAVLSGAWPAALAGGEGGGGEEDGAAPFVLARARVEFAALEATRVLDSLDFGDALDVAVMTPRLLRDSTVDGVWRFGSAGSNAFCNMGHVLEDKVLAFLGKRGRVMVSDAVMNGGLSYESAAALNVLGDELDPLAFEELLRTRVSCDGYAIDTPEGRAAAERLAAEPDWVPPRKLRAGPRNCTAGVELKAPISEKKYRMPPRDGRPGWRWVRGRWERAPPDEAAWEPPAPPEVLLEEAAGRPVVEGAEVVPYGYLLQIATQNDAMQPELLRTHFMAAFMQPREPGVSMFRLIHRPDFAAHMTADEPRMYVHRVVHHSRFLCDWCDYYTRNWRACVRGGRVPAIDTNWVLRCFPPPPALVVDPAHVDINDDAAMAPLWDAHYARVAAWLRRFGAIALAPPAEQDAALLPYPTFSRAEWAARRGAAFRTAPPPRPLY